MADHRAEQILAAVKTALDGDGTFSVFRGRVDPITEDLQEIPAACVFMGSDEPKDEDGFEVVGSYDSVLTVYVDVWEVAEREDDLESLLNELRKKVHIAIMGTTRLGLAFVLNLAPQGADEPERSVVGHANVGKHRTIWIVEYRSSVNDPSA